jgi:hypothetical protein
MGVDAPLEVAVAREHGGHHQVPFLGTALAMSSGSGPELPMQVVQP